MARSSNHINVYLEIGAKRTFAGALDWPGWCRSGRDEDSALQALLDYGPRYGHVPRTARLGFNAPADLSELVVAERLKGNATTDFGAPGLAPSSDAKPVDAVELQRLQKLLKACWRIFDKSIAAATGKALRTGPRGGGRDLEGIREHLLGSDVGYVTQLGWKLQPDDREDHQQIRQAILQALTASANGEIPVKGPRGGIRWTARYFVRRTAWHILDHAWELEDRVLSE
ncbi:MAG TPA: hypothetical protein VK249_29055 [Anaerolineales bacterium]|nr:hypothetical protein [Anaerolineales bacterium]